MEKSKYKIGDKVIFKSQVFIITDLGYRSPRYWYFIKEYNKRTTICKIIPETFLKPYNE